MGCVADDAGKARWPFRSLGTGGTIPSVSKFFQFLSMPTVAELARPRPQPEEALVDGVGSVIAVRPEAGADEPFWLCRLEGAQTEGGDVAVTWLELQAEGDGYELGDRGTVPVGSALAPVRSQLGALPFVLQDSDRSLIMARIAALDAAGPPQAGSHVGVRVFPDHGAVTALEFGAAASRGPAPSPGFTTPQLNTLTDALACFLRFVTAKGLVPARLAEHQAPPHYSLILSQKRICAESAKDSVFHKVRSRSCLGLRCPLLRRRSIANGA